MIFQVIHKTSYRYDNFVSYCHNLATLRPRDLTGQKLLDFDLQIKPTPSELTERTDFFGNNLTRFSIQEPHNELKVIAKSYIDRDFQAITERYESDACRGVTMQQTINCLQKVTPECLDAKQYILESPLIRKIASEIRAYGAESFQLNRSVFEATKELMTRIYTDFQFVPGFSDVATPLHTVFAEKKGVCQDFAQIAIACMRAVGLPAKYMSGYIETLPPEGKEKLVGADASHAWFSTFIPGFGWVDFDPTNNLIPENQHLVVAWGRDYYDVPPLKGVIYSNGNNEMSVSVDIREAEFEVSE
ncbi:transglutaminase family protein [Mangrovibacterium diazotrophicum]|uniref:Transglutaminase-like putative cysteine protease n=1 Tax=Mangrovibacterium diazotrophicum TaxID=1261403 RepID=A0A419W458_9BACT|nr:transglutaminase family protein [Mangrovibacterium diazotrophicum]RKD90232.1 transglutaminase-like putative cysteine protease [Mangrovibacterium diazotrophicum]